MVNEITILGKLDGKPKSGYTVKLYKYSSAHAPEITGSTASPYYSPSTGLIGTFTDGSDGTYYIDISTDVKGVVVITTPSTTNTVTPKTHRGRIFHGDNKLTIPPASST